MRLGMSKVSSVYSIIMGSALLMTWAVLFLTDSVQELETPVKLALLLAAEILTALTLIVGGYGILSAHKWGITVQLIGLGMLLYCAIFTCGEMGQAGNFPAAISFAVISVTTMVICGYFIIHVPAKTS
jgi:hypothetical protein